MRMILEDHDEDEDEDENDSASSSTISNQNVSTECWKNILDAWAEGS